MTMLRQILVVSLLNFRNLRQRLWQSLVIVVGMACVSGVLLSMLSVTEGLHQAYLNNGDPRNVIIVSHGSTRDGGSAIPRGQARIILNAPGIARAPDGAPIADANFMTGVPVRLKKNNQLVGIRLYTFGKMGTALQPHFHLVAGRMFQPGKHELIAGIMDQSKFKGMALGDKVGMPDGQWPIVGVFASGDQLEGWLVGDTETVMQVMRQNNYNTVLARLASPGAFGTFAKALTDNPTLTVDAVRLPEWNALTSDQTSAFFNVLVYGVSIILAIGALFGCLNTMYAAIDSRGREIATLRTLGYGGFAVAFSVVLEAGALSVTGALIGAGFAWTMYNDVQGTLGGDFFKLIVSPTMIGSAIAWGIVVAVLGGLLPSIQAARWTLSEALRAK